MRRGITVAELLVAVGLFALVTTALVSALSPGLSAWRTRQVQAQLQQEVVVTLERMVSELRMAAQQSIEVQPGTYTDDITHEEVEIDRLTCVTPSDTTILDVETGAIVWKFGHTFYVDPTTHELREQIRTLPSPSTSPEFSAVATLPLTEERVVARGVHRLRVKASPRTGDGRFVNPVRLSVRVTRDGFASEAHAAVTVLHEALK